ncbi:MAG: hypothetical protein ACI4U2_00870 [Christensenellaceae bacterium]
MSMTPKYVPLAYGGVYDTKPSTCSLAAGVPAIVPMADTMPSSGMICTENGITVKNAGTYQIQYSFTGTSVKATDMVLTVRKNGAAIPGGTQTAMVGAGEEVNLSGTVLVTLCAKDTVVMMICSSAATTVTEGECVAASLVITQVDGVKMVPTVTKVIT